MLQKLQTKIQDNPLAVIVLIAALSTFLILSVVAIMQPGIHADPPANNTTNETQQNLVTNQTLNTQNVVLSHYNATTAQKTTKTSLTIYRNNTTAYVQNTKLDQNNYQSFTREITGNTNEIWVKSNNTTTLFYDYQTETVTKPNDIDLEERQTQTRFIRTLLNAGKYNYITSSPTGKSHFTLTEITNKSQLLFAFPAVPNDENATITSTQINGVIQNGQVKQINGSFQHTISYQDTIGANGNTTQNITKTTNYRFTFTTTTDKTTYTIQKPSWVSEYETEQNTTTNETPSNTTRTQSSNTTNTQTPTQTT